MSYRFYITNIDNEVSGTDSIADALDASLDPDNLVIDVQDNTLMPADEVESTIPLYPA